MPALCVVVDGGWSKRSHKHSYNTNSGVAIILGKAIHIGMQNKFCTACSRNIPKEELNCFKNWNASSSEMEVDIIVGGGGGGGGGGLLKQKRYMESVTPNLFAYGDSSVYCTLIQQVPSWGHAIRKLECATKCYRGSLEKLVQDNPSYKRNGGLSEKMR